MDNTFENRLQAIEYELSQIAESEYLNELTKKFNNELDVDVVLNIIPSRDISFKTRSLLSAILNRLELSQQDRLDLEKYIIYGGGDNIEYLKQTLAVWVEWKDKILNIIKDAPEEFDSLIEIFNYINDHIVESNIKLDNIPFEKGSGENSAVLKGGNNQVISEGGVALGNNNIAGLKGFYYKHIRFVSNTLANVYLSRTQTVPTVTTGDETNDTTIIPSDYYAIGDSVSIVNDDKYDNIAVINNMSAGLIQIRWNNEAPFDLIKEETDLEPEDYSIYSLDKPTKGISDLGHNSFAAGYNNEATNVGAAAFGRGNKAYGKFSFVEGRDNTAAYSSHTEGRENVNDGYFAHVEGYSNENYSNSSHVEGVNNINKSKRGHIEGTKNKADNADTVHIEGALNYFGTEDVTIPNTSSLFKDTTHIEGQGNIDKGSSTSHIEGRQNINYGGGYSHIEGRENVLQNTNSSRGCHIEGYKNEVDGVYLHVEGNGNKAAGNNGHVEGSLNVINNQSEHAQGRANVSHKATQSFGNGTGTIHSVGIGTSITERKNAHEIMDDGKHYIYGIGGYDGTNAVTPNAQGIIAKSVQEVINELVNIIKQITISETI